MDLRDQFICSPNIGVLAEKWLSHLIASISDAGVKSSVQTRADGAVSLIAPAALLARFIELEFETPVEHRLRILVVSEDPIGIMDSGVWCNYAAQFAGLEHGVDVFSVFPQEVQSNLYPVAIDLGLKPFQLIDAHDAQTQGWDLVAWIHPALESGKASPAAGLIAQLQHNGAPVYGCVYNELDGLVQTYGLSSHGLEFQWVGGSKDGACVLDSTSVNQFGISIRSTGIEGGWGAVMGRIQPKSHDLSPTDWALVRTAMNLFRLEGVHEAPWSFGETVPGVAFNKYVPVGLIGNIAVERSTGQVFSQCSVTNVLNVKGQLWESIRAEMPSASLDLVAWACRVKLCFTTAFSREDKARAETIELLSEAYRLGIVEAGIALARGYEAIATKESKARAAAIYREIGSAHPMSAYVLAHQELEADRAPEAVRLFESSADSGYTLAMTDLARLLTELGTDPQRVLQLIDKAAGKGDPEAQFLLAERLIQAGLYNEALPELRRAWSQGHEQALIVAEWLCTEMLSRKLGKSGELKRELKDVRFQAAKRQRYAADLEKSRA